MRRFILKIVEVSRMTFAVRTQGTVQSYVAGGSIDFYDNRAFRHDVGGSNPASGRHNFHLPGSTVVVRPDHAQQVPDCRAQRNPGFRREYG